MASRSGHALLALLGCSVLLVLHAATASEIGTTQTGPLIVDPIAVSHTTHYKNTDRAAAAHRGTFDNDDTAALAQQSSNEEEQPADVVLSAETEAAVDKLLEKLKQEDAAAAAPKQLEKQPKNVAEHDPKTKKDTNSAADDSKAPKHHDVAPKIPRPGNSNNSGAGARKEDKNTSNNKNAAARNVDKQIDEEYDRGYRRRSGQGRYPPNPAADEYRARDYEQQQQRGDSYDTPYDAPDSYAGRHGSDGYEKRRSSPPEPENTYAHQPHREQQQGYEYDGYGPESSTEYKYDGEQAYDNDSPQQPDDYNSEAYKGAYDSPAGGPYAKRDRYGSPKEEGKPFPWVNGPYGGDSYRYNRLPDIYKHEDLYDVYTNGGYVSLGGLDVSESSLLADLTYTGDRNCSGVLNATETTATVTLDLAAASPVSDDAPPVKQLDGPFGFWMAHLEKYVTLEPLPDCPFVEIEGVASRPTRIILQGRTAPTASTDVDEVTGVLSYQTSGTVPNFPIDWDELTKLTLKFNGQSRYTIEEIEVSDGSWFTLLDASFSIKIVARLRA